VITTIVIMIVTIQEIIMICRMKSERQEPDHFLKRGQGESIKAHGGSPTRRSPHPPKAGAYAARSNPPNTAFRRFYERGDLPIAVEHRGMKNVISWKVITARWNYFVDLSMVTVGMPTGVPVDSEAAFAA